MDVVGREDEDLLLELLNTTPVVDGKRVDELAEPGVGANWAKARGGGGTAGEVETLRRIRDALQEVVSGTADPQTLAPLFERVTLQSQLRDGALDWQLRAPADETMSARVLLAWASIAERAPGRLRPCANSECLRFLVDRSNANTARWCSMAVCGNRVKARRHYQRRASELT